MKRHFSGWLILFSAISSIALNACSIKAHSATDLPPAMSTLFIESSEPYGQLTTQLTRQLKALDVHLVNSPQKAPITLNIISNTFSAPLPKLTTSASTFSYSYNLTTRFELKTRANQPVVKRSLSTSASLIQNAEQMYTPSATALMKRELTRTMVTLIYEQLTKEDTKKRVASAVAAETKAYREHNGTQNTAT